MSAWIILKNKILRLKLQIREFLNKMIKIKVKIIKKIR